MTSPKKILISESFAEPSLFSYGESLRQEGFEAEWVSDQTPTVAANLVCAALEKQQFELMLVDVNYPADPFGGFVILDAISDAGLWSKARSKVLYTIYGDPNDAKHLTILEKANEREVQVWSKTEDLKSSIVDQVVNYLADQC